MKKKDHKPTGQSVQTARNAGYSSVLEMLNVKGPDNLCQEEEVEIVGETPKKAVASNKGPELVSPWKMGKQNSFDGKTDADLNSQKLATNCSEKKSKKTKQEGDCSHLCRPSQLTPYKLKCDKEPLNSRLGPPDFHPQTPNCTEETLTRDNVQYGHFGAIKGILEYSEVLLTQVQASTKPFIVIFKEAIRKRLRAINESRPQKRKAGQVFGVPLSDSQLAKTDIFPEQRPFVGDFRKKWIEVHWAILFNGEKVLVKVQRPGLNSANEDWQEKLELERMKHDGEKVLVKVQSPGLNSGKKDWQEKLEKRQMQLDMEIMIMDTSGLTPIQQEYFHLRQMEILEDCLNSHHHWNVFL